MTKILPLILGALLMANVTNAQSLLYEIPLDAQVRQSSQIVEGKVIHKQSFWNADYTHIFTVNTIEVFKVFKGQNHSRVDLITPGGAIGLQAEKVMPCLELNVQDEGVFMLYDNDLALVDYNTESAVFRPYSSVQGFYKYDLIRNQAVNPFNRKQDIQSAFYTQLETLTSRPYSVIKDNQLNQRLTTNKSAFESRAVNQISPEVITAGTGSVLTITGTGFTPGGQTGTVSFPDANFGGSAYFTVLENQILSYTDTEIQVEVPSRAGSGPVRVDTFVGPEFSTDLTINYAQINLTTDVGTGVETAYRTQHINSNFTGGMTWNMNPDFASNEPARLAWLRALEPWVCTTGINWIVGLNNGPSESDRDGTNAVNFGSLADGTLGITFSYFNGCNTSTGIQWFVPELDMEFSNTINWNFGPAPAGASEFDFETVAVHELGHGTQLAHVIDTNKIMHFSVGNGTTNRDLTQDDIDGASDVHLRSTTNLLSCSSGLMTDSSCFLSVDEVDLNASVSLYPNPVKSILTVKTHIQIKLDALRIYDVHGKLISNTELHAGNQTHTIDLNDLATGIYFAKLQSGSNTIVKKLIKD